MHVSHGLSSSTQPIGISAAWSRVDVLEHLSGPADDVAPLDQLELGRRRHSRPAGLRLVGRSVCANVPV